MAGAGVGTTQRGYGMRVRGRSGFCPDFIKKNLCVSLRTARMGGWRDFMKTTLNLQERLLSELHPADYNPRVALKPGDPEYENIKNS